MQATRAHSVSTLPSSAQGMTPAIASMPTLASPAQAPPWAQVLPSYKRPSRAVSSDDLEQRLHSMDSSANLQFQQKVSQLEEEKEITQSTLREAEARLLVEVD